jgi:hypothetical protein
MLDPHGAHNDRRVRRGLTRCLVRGITGTSFAVASSGLGRLEDQRPGSIQVWAGALVTAWPRRTKNHRDGRSSDLGATSDEGRLDALADFDESGYRLLRRGRACSFERAGGDADRLTGQQSGVDLIREPLQHARVDVLGPMDAETLDLRFSHDG